MAASEHTRGTWVVVNDKGEDYSVCAFDGDPADGIMSDVICEILSIKDEEDANLIAAAPALLAALKALVDEFGCSIEQYHKIGPDFTHKDGTETLHASTLLDREPLIEAARAAIATATGAAS